MSEALPDSNELLRKACFVPCHSKEHLHRWIEVYLGLNIPDCRVDPMSTASPMDVIWEIYERGLKNDQPEFQRALAFAARDSFKTLGAAILEVLAIVHLERSVAHMAAIEAQAKKAQSYVKDFFSRPILRDYIVGDNARRIEFLRYYNPQTGDNLTQKQYEEVAEPARAIFEKKFNYINIILCTMQSTNSEHVLFLVIDEIDVIPKQHLKAYEEAKMIPAPRDGKMPITLLISTRKFSFGKVQQEIDEAAVKEGSDGSGLQIRHWNILDVTEQCPAKRHRPDLPKIPIYRSDETLRALSQEQYNKLDNEMKEKGKYVLDEGYRGCLDNCRLFAMCQGRLVTGSRPLTKGSLLKPIDFTIHQFRAVSPPTAKAQLLCRKPSTEGLIYPAMERSQHMLKPHRIASMITGEDHPETMTRDTLIALLKQREIRFVAGIDHGFTHNFAVVLFAIDGARAFVIGSWAIPELDPAQKLKLCEDKLRDLDPAIYADPEQPDMNKMLKKHGFKIKEWVKGKGSVLGGIEVVRFKLAPTLGEPNLFFLEGDDGVEYLFKCLSRYHWAIGADGKPTDQPDENIDNETTDDGCDACRYGLMNVYKPKGKITVSPETQDEKPKPAAVLNQYSQADWARKVIEEATGNSFGGEDVVAPIIKGKKGGFIFDL